LDSNSGAIKTAVELIDDAVYTDGSGTPSKGLLIMGSDGTNPQTIKTDADGNLQVDILSGGGAGEQYADGTAVDAGYKGNIVLGTDGSNYQAISTHTDGAVKVKSIADSVTVTATDLDIRNLTATDVVTAELSATDNAVLDAIDTVLDAINTKLVSGTDIGDVTINNAAGSPVYVAPGTSTYFPVSKDTNANSELNPIFVQQAAGVSGGEVHDYDTSAAVGAGSSDTHTYTVTTGKTLLLKQIIFSASDYMKVEIKTGASGGTATKAVVFTAAANPNGEVTFAVPLEVASTHLVEVVRTNKGILAQDVYSTIIGTEV
jgi:hypothetical protein